LDHFDGKIEEGAGKHQVQSLSQVIDAGAPPCDGKSAVISK
jgi:hypothetical protein